MEPSNAPDSKATYVRLRLRLTVEIGTKIQRSKIPGMGRSLVGPSFLRSILFSFDYDDDNDQHDYINDHNNYFY